MAETKICSLIQWERKQVPADDNGEPVCPECGEPAEMILGIFGQPCWGHKITPGWPFDDEESSDV